MTIREILEIGVSSRQNNSASLVEIIIYPGKDGLNRNGGFVCS